jgi:hypothetical protein
MAKGLLNFLIGGGKERQGIVPDELEQEVAKVPHSGKISRRSFLKGTAGVGGLLLTAACGQVVAEPGRTSTPEVSIPPLERTRVLIEPPSPTPTEWLLIPTPSPSATPFPTATRTPTRLPTPEPTKAPTPEQFVNRWGFDWQTSWKSDRVAFPLCSYSISSWDLPVTKEGGNYIALTARQGAEIYAPIAGKAAVGTLGFQGKEVFFLKITDDNGKKLFILVPKDKIPLELKEAPKAFAFKDPLFVVPEETYSILVGGSLDAFPLKEGGSIVCLCPGIK